MKFTIAYFAYALSSIISPSALADSVKTSEFYTSYLHGNARDAQPDRNPAGGVMLMGGGASVKESFQWLLNRARDGDALILRASGDNDLNLFFSSLESLDSAETLVFSDRQASFDPYIIDQINHAEVIFIAGGDQGRYLSFWSDSPVQKALNDSILRGIPVGGTSAGLAIMGQFIYAAPNGASIRSEEALANPYIDSLSLSANFLEIPLLSGFITDTHFSARDRMGRLASFLARITADNMGNGVIKALAIDEQTAVVIETQRYSDRNPGEGKVFGKGHAYLLSTPEDKPQLCAQGQPLSYYGLRVERYAPGQNINIAVGTETVEDDADIEHSPLRYLLDIEEGQIHSSTGQIYKH